MSAIWRSQQRQTAAYFDKLALSRHPDHTVGDWGNKIAQLTRFRVLAELATLTNLSVLDVGCGLTHFADYINSYFEGIRYTGIDISAKCVEVAQHLYPERDIQHIDLFNYKTDTTFDIVIANGLFYLLKNNSEQQMYSIVQHLFDLTHFALAFSSLSISDDIHTNNDEFRADPLLIFDYCRSLTPWVTLRHDYHPGDFIIYMYKEQP
jgi:SAM-dependent methyltransferase